MRCALTRQSKDGGSRDRFFNECGRQFFDLSFRICQIAASTATGLNLSGDGPPSPTAAPHGPGSESIGCRIYFEHADMLASALDHRAPFGAETGVGSIRHRIRTGAYNGHTSGQAPRNGQGNVVILPAELATDFLLFCQRNP